MYHPPLGNQDGVPPSPRDLERHGHGGSVVDAVPGGSRNLGVTDDVQLGHLSEQLVVELSVRHPLPGDEDEVYVDPLFDPILAGEHDAPVFNCFELRFRVEFHRMGGVVLESREARLALSRNVMTLEELEQK